MSKKFRVRVDYDSELFGFDTKDELFAWVDKNYEQCVASVLTYEQGELQDMSRYYCRRNSRPKKEDLSS